MERDDWIIPSLSIVVQIEHGANEGMPEPLRVAESIGIRDVKVALE